MSTQTITDWLTFTPAGVIRKAKAYIDLPAFSYASQGTAGQASIIVAQFNFSASRNFYLLTRPAKPTGVNYGLCIRYRVGNTVYRYKLWEDSSFILGGVSLYNKELIKANFVLEVWNFAGSASSQASALRMITSVRSMPTNLRSIADYALAVGAEFTNLQNINPTLPATPSHRWTCDGADTTVPWTDSIAGVQFSTAGSVGTPTAPYLESPDSTWLRGRWKFTDGSARNFYTTFPYSTWDGMMLYVVGAVTLGGALQRTMLRMTNFFDMAVGNTDQLRCGQNSGFFDQTIPDSLPHIFSVGRLASPFTFMNGRIDELGGGSSSDASITPVTGSLDFALATEKTGLNDGRLDIAEVLIFKDRFEAQGSAFDLAVQKYLNWYHFGTVTFPFTFDTGSAWLDNA
jgi:hypothetical protein